MNNAKDHHNVIDECFFNIPLENVSSSIKIHIVHSHYIYIGMYSGSAPLTWHLQSDLVPAWRCFDGTGPKIGEVEEW